MKKSGVIVLWIILLANFCIQISVFSAAVPRARQPIASPPLLRLDGSHSEGGALGGSRSSVGGGDLNRPATSFAVPAPIPLGSYASGGSLPLHPHRSFAQSAYTRSENSGSLIEDDDLNRSRAQSVVALAPIPFRLDAARSASTKEKDAARSASAKEKKEDKEEVEELAAGLSTPTQVMSPASDALPMGGWVTVHDQERKEKGAADDEGRIFSVPHHAFEFEKNEYVRSIKTYTYNKQAYLVVLVESLEEDLALMHGKICHRIEIFNALTGERVKTVSMRASKNVFLETFNQYIILASNFTEEQEGYFSQISIWDIKTKRLVKNIFFTDYIASIFSSEKYFSVILQRNKCAFFSTDLVEIRPLGAKQALLRDAVSLQIEKTKDIIRGQIFCVMDTCFILDQKLFIYSKGKHAFVRTIDHLVRMIACTGDTIIMGRANGTIGVIKNIVGAPVSFELEHRSEVGAQLIASLALDTAGAVAVTGSFGRTIKIWDILGKKCLETLRLKEVPYMLALSDKGVVIAAVQSTTRVGDGARVSISRVHVYTLDEAVKKLLKKDASCCVIL